MSCELCGKETVACRARVEGVEMELCASCASHGKDPRPLRSAPTRSAQRKAPVRVVPQAPTTEEIVRPDTARLLRADRERRKMTQEEYARLLGIRLSTYHHYENGSALPDLQTARKLQHALHEPLVVHVRRSETQAGPRTEQGMTLGDFIPRR